MRTAEPLLWLPLLLFAAVWSLPACPVSDPPGQEDQHRRHDEDACETGEIGCLDDHRAFVCSDDGSERVEAPCRDDQLCQDGACRTVVCTAGTSECQGSARVVCDDTGTGETVDPCDTSTTCQDDGLGCACSMGFCLPRICEPASGRCVGNSAQACSADGLEHGELLDCGIESCHAGRCLADVCTAGATLCSGRVMLTCDADGVGYDETTCDEACGGPDGSAACTALLCMPLSSSCADDHTVAQCNAQGTATALADCGSRQRCSSGVCLDQVCEPSSSTCVGDSVRACNADGSAETLTACDTGYSCGNGACVEDSCAPQCGGRVCGPDPTCGRSCGDCEGTCTDAGACQAFAGPVLSVELSWTPTSKDLDLYVSKSGTVCDADTCFYSTCTLGDVDRPDWDHSGGPSGGDPVLDITSPTDANPEIARVPLPAGAQSYTIAADHYTTDGAAATATLRLRVDGTLVSTHTRALSPDELWKGVVVSWSGSSASATDSGEVIAGFSCDQPAGQQCTVDTDCPTGEACLDGGFLQTDTCAPGCRTSAECGALQACNGARDCVSSSTVKGWKQACATLADCGAGYHCDFLTQLCEEECTVGCSPGADCCLRSGGDSCVTDPILQMFGNCAP